MQKATLSVLLVEDSPLYNFNTKKIMETSGLVGDAVICSSGKEALGYLAFSALKNRLLPDVIFIDLAIATSNASEFLEAYGQMAATFSKNIQLYLFASSAGEIGILEKQFSFINGHLLKPVLKENLIQALSR